jgi:hypothetical protein
MGGKLRNGVKGKDTSEKYPALWHRSLAARCAASERSVSSLCDPGLGENCRTASKAEPTKDSRSKPSTYCHASTELEVNFTARTGGEAADVFVDCCDALRWSVVIMW